MLAGHCSSACHVLPSFQRQQQLSRIFPEEGQSIPRKPLTRMNLQNRIRGRRLIRRIDKQALSDLHERLPIDILIHEPLHDTESPELRPNFLQLFETSADVVLYAALVEPVARERGAEARAGIFGSSDAGGARGATEEGGRCVEGSFGAGSRC